MALLLMLLKLDLRKHKSFVLVLERSLQSGWLKKMEKGISIPPRDLGLENRQTRWTGDSRSWLGTESARWSAANWGYLSIG